MFYLFQLNDNILSLFVDHSIIIREFYWLIFKYDLAEVIEEVVKDILWLLEYTFEELILFADVIMINPCVVLIISIDFGLYCERLIIKESEMSIVLLDCSFEASNYSKSLLIYHN